MELAEHAIGVCSWSLQCHSTGELVKAVKELSLCHIQLALNPLIDQGDQVVAQTLKELEQGRMTLTAGMIGFAGEDYTSIATIRQTGGFAPTNQWPERSKLLVSAAKVAQQLGLDMVSTHVGFIPSSNEPSYGIMVERVQQAADIFADRGIAMLTETGQEAASELLQFLNDVARPTVGVNFDPANMILYGAGNPVDAVRILGRHVRHVHIKDAVASEQPGTLWGEEVPFGKGQVNAMAFLESLRFGGYRGPLMVEREAGHNRMADIRHALGVLSPILQPRPAADGE